MHSGLQYEESLSFLEKNLDEHFENELNHILEQTSIENLTNSSRIVETSNNITYYQITDENNIIGFENETYIAINNNNPSNIIIIGSYDLDLLKQITPTIKNK